MPVCGLLEVAAQRSGHAARHRALRVITATQRVLARLPLIQQTHAAHGWRRWFDAMGVRDAARAEASPRYELFSMTAVAAARIGWSVA